MGRLAAGGSGGGGGGCGILSRRVLEVRRVGGLEASQVGAAASLRMEGDAEKLSRVSSGRGALVLPAGGRVQAVASSLAAAASSAATLPVRTAAASWCSR